MHQKAAKRRGKNKMVGQTENKSDGCFISQWAILLNINELNMPIKRQGLSDFSFFKEKLSLTYKRYSLNSSHRKVAD